MISILFISGSANALTCEVKFGVCESGETTLLKMSATDNAHAELSNQSNYNYYVCCSGELGLGNSCNGNSDVILRLSGATDAQVEKNTESTPNYNENYACISANLKPACIYANSCSDDYECLLSISLGDTNLHVGNCDVYGCPDI